MKPIYALIALIALGCSDPESTEPAALYDYSAPEEAADMLLSAADVINEAAGCRLVGSADSAGFVNPIVTMDKHPGGPNVVGCAFIGEALRRAEMPRDTILIDWVLGKGDAGILTTAHEIGHTLGLLHVADFNTIMYPVISDSLVWDDASKAQLQALCDAEPDTTGMLDELVVDRAK